MDVKITPSKLKGRISAPSSKSFSHRMIIAASLADGISIINNVTSSVDIEATVNAMIRLGAKIIIDGSTYTIKGIGNKPCQNAVIDCCESGSTLRFVIPIAAALGCSTEFDGKGKLPSRPVTPYIREMSKKGVEFNYNNTMPFTIAGKLVGGEYNLEGNISSQFITGLLYALPLCEKNSVIKITSPLESKPYIDITISVLSAFGIKITEAVDNNLPIYIINGKQNYISSNQSVEGDYSQAAFFFVANALGSEVNIQNLNTETTQGDKKILDILHDIGYNDMTKPFMEPFTVDVSNIPDLVPILAVLGCFTSGKCRIVNAKRLKIKESDRLIAIANALNNIGGKVTAFDDSLEIEPIEQFTGGTVDSCNDHRIVMAAAIASTKSSGNVIIKGAEAVSKSYPAFFDDFNRIGGQIEFIK
jgi:3-phosphoshikimate 1-carboxyvinyltransferase